MRRLLAAALCAALALPGYAHAWGGTGHRYIGLLAVRNLPAEIPPFLRAPQAAVEIGELSREPDRTKGSGKLHDHDRDAAHFADVDDDGRLLGGPTLETLPPTRAEYEAALQKAGTDSWKAGYLPYAIADRHQQLTLEFGYWRVLKAAEADPKWRSHRAFFRADRIRREQLLMKTIGELSHFVGDGSQPLHVTHHYNGWAEGPNPQGFTRAKIHSPFESEMVRSAVTLDMVARQMRPLHICDCAIERRTAAYLKGTSQLAPTLYALEKAGGLVRGDPRGPEFASRQMGIGASELRDLIVEAWRASLDRKVGWRPVAVKDVLSGAVDPYPALYGVD